MTNRSKKYFRSKRIWKYIRKNNIVAMGILPDGAWVPFKEYTEPQPEHSFIVPFRFDATNCPEFVPMD